jgi:hypothetical protein
MSNNYSLEEILTHDGLTNKKPLYLTNYFRKLPYILTISSNELIVFYFKFVKNSCFNNYLVRPRLFNRHNVKHGEWFNDKLCLCPVLQFSQSESVGFKKPCFNTACPIDSQQSIAFIPGSYEYVLFEFFDKHLNLITDLSALYNDLENFDILLIK